MRSIENIISESVEALRPLLQEAFEAGRAQASADLRAKINGVLAIGQTATVVVERTLPNGGKRAVSGSVRPTITRMIADSGIAGVTADEILKATGFKPNSVRGTLWTLGKEELAVKRHGRWFLAQKSSSPEGETEAVGASVLSH